MSLRSAVRISTRSARVALGPRAVVGRRAASSTSSKKTSDATWMMGSAVVFGGLAAYILMGGSTPHDAHAAHEAIGSKNHKTAEDKGENEGPTSLSSGSDDDSGPSEDETDGPGAHKKAHADNDKHPEQITTKKIPGKPAPSQKSGQDEKVGQNEEKKKDTGKSGKMEAEDNEGRTADEVPSEEMQKRAIERGEKTDAPKVAMDEEAKGHETQAELDK